MFVEQVMPRARERLVTIAGAATVKNAAALMSKPHTDIVVVCDEDGEMIGVITKTDIVTQMNRCIGGGCVSRVATVMTKDVVTCRPEDPLQDVWSTMKARGLQRIPVLDRNRKPMGIIYARDALQSLLGEVEDDEALLRDYVMGIGYQ